MICLKINNYWYRRRHPVLWYSWLKGEYTLMERIKIICFWAISMLLLLAVAAGCGGEPGQLEEDYDGIEQGPDEKIGEEQSGEKVLLPTDLKFAAYQEEP